MDSRHTIDALLRTTMELGATDLHLCAGSRPLVRVSSKLTPLEGTEKLLPDDINLMIGEYLDENSRIKLFKDKIWGT